MTRSRWWVAALPVLLCVGVYAALRTMVAHGASMDEAYRVEGLLARAAAALGCGIAAAQFDRGDHMRRAWLILGTTYVLLLGNALVFGAAGHLSERTLPAAAKIVSAVLVAAANVCTIVGALSVARTWRLAGLDLQVSRTVRFASMAASLAIALAIAGSTSLLDLKLALGGHFDALSYLASDLGDIVSLGVLAPILLTALALRGGTLAWPWGLIVLGTVGWVLHDASGPIATALGMAPSELKPLSEAFRWWGCVAYLSAGLLQRQARLELSAPPPQLAVG